MNDDDSDRDGRSAGELAAALLGRLRLDGGGALLGCGAAERVRYGSRFHELAVERLAARGVAREEIRRAERYVVLLVERAFEEVGELPEAAAFYALAHDERLAPADARSDYERAALRFKLGHTLFLLGEHEAANLERCTAFGRETAAMVEDLEPGAGVPRNTVRLLAMELQGWLGGRYEAQGELGAAAAAFLAAARAATGADDRVAFTARAAAAMTAAGRAAEAGRALAAVRRDLPELRSGLSRRLWDAGWAALGTAPPDA
ncbi:MAG TPA: hypothetical protein VNJ70_13735 [Thermoanaerobaculia bacterium]|nr:hypothetical protein [Thermoanaerobaculia bacterium]